MTFDISPSRTSRKSLPADGIVSVTPLPADPGAVTGTGGTSSVHDGVGRQGRSQPS